MSRQQTKPLRASADGHRQWPQVGALHWGLFNPYGECLCFAEQEVLPGDFSVAMNQALIVVAPQAQNHPMFCGIFRPL
ncbi:hypothetical protein PSEUDO8Z_90117 [Pseudomonas sp. 8Z]|nr:hypothetical protein PSEUDO8Z_90117 [Pseudomonas sp. 8Z]